jgi:2-polyprenyl-6-methoxyphenol hydroxylase-like FAD-dependent oxidoreductase
MHDLVIVGGGPVGAAAAAALSASGLSTLVLKRVATAPATIAAASPCPRAAA